MQNLKWQRTSAGYRSGTFDITDNGGGFGPAKGNGRWAVSSYGRWLRNLDTLAEAQAFAEAEAQVQADNDVMEGAAQ